MIGSSTLTFCAMMVPGMLRRVPRPDAEWKERRKRKRKKDLDPFKASKKSKKGRNDIEVADAGFFADL